MKDKEGMSQESIMELVNPIIDGLKDASKQLGKIKTDIIKASTKFENKLDKAAFYTFVGIGFFNVHHSVNEIAIYVRDEMGIDDE